MKTLKRIEKLHEAVMFVATGIDRKLVVADIATDHGYLAESLSKNDKIERVIATDISEKCLKKLVELIDKNKLEKIETIVGDGLSVIEKTDVSVVAGVGGWEIIKMLKNQNKTPDGTTKCDLFVLQPAQNALELREWLFDNNVYVVKDYIVEDAGRFYPVIIIDISKKQTNEKSVFNMWIGRDNSVESEDFVKFLKETQLFLKFLEDISIERIESDKVLKEKFELKLIIDKLLEK